VKAVEDDGGAQRPFPLEPLTCFAGRKKLTPESQSGMRFWIERQLAKTYLADLRVLSLAQFEQVDWDVVHTALESVPRMFQIWACKQVLSLANTNGTISKWDKSMDPRCPSCKGCTETAEHVLLCNEAGRVDIFLKTVDLLDGWLRKMGTAPALRTCIVKFCKGRGYKRMRDVLGETNMDGMARMAISQDEIGWRRFMEGMVSRRLIEVQREFFTLRGAGWKLQKWATGLVVRLLEITHGQWLYRNVVVHDAVSGQLASTRKEDIEAQIVDQLAHGGDGLLASDSYLMEVNLGEIAESTGAQHEYWLLAIKAARVAGQIAQEAHARDGTDYG
jgi:hypothetical protein